MPWITRGDVRSGFREVKSGQWSRMLSLSDTQQCGADRSTSPKYREKSGLDCILGITHMTAFKAVRPEGHLKTKCPWRRYLSPEPGPCRVSSSFRMKRGGISKRDLGKVARERGKEPRAFWEPSEDRCCQEHLSGWSTGLEQDNTVVPGHLDTPFWGHGRVKAWLERV